MKGTTAFSFERPDASEFGTPTVSREVESWESPWLPSVYAKAIALASRPANWDSYGSPKITEEALAWTKRLLLAADKVCELPAPHLAPVSGGGLQLELRNGSKELELEVLPDGTLQFLAVDEAADSENEGICENRYADPQKWMRWLARL